MNIQPKNRPMTLKITRRIKDSGFLAVHGAEVLQTLIALPLFADKDGKCLVSARELARTLNISLKEAKKRLDTVLKIRWQSKPLVVKESGEGYEYLLFFGKEFGLI